MLVKNNTQRIIGCLDGKVRLIPGLNSVHNAEWAEISKDSLIQHKLEVEELEELEGKSSASGVDALLKMAEKKAAKLVKETVDRDLLKDWAAKEKRASIVKLIEAQLAELADVKFREESQVDTESAGADGSEG